MASRMAVVWLIPSNTDSRPSMLTPAQLRGARAMLQLTQQELSDLAKVPRSSIAEFEAEERRPRQATLERLREALERAGATFIETSSAVGVTITLSQP